MSVALTYTLTINGVNAFINTVDGGTGSDRRALPAFSKELTNGTGASQANVFSYDEFDITTGATATIDLSALPTMFGTGNLSGAGGKLKLLVLELVTATTGYTAKLMAGASNGFSACFSDASDELIFGAGSPLVIASLVDGFTVDSTHKTLKVTNPAGGTASYKLTVVGVGAVA
jgi:hypothetical protein